MIAAAGLLVAGTLLWLGRRDVTRPTVAFGVPWFAFAALAQLRLTEFERSWSTEYAILVFGGGLTFVVAATLAGGTAPARGRVGADRQALRVRRLVTVTLLLMAAGVAGAAYKAHALEGIPLFSEDPDRVRAAATRPGGVDLPAWSTALTNGFFLAMWCSLVAIWALPRGRSWSKAGLWLLVAAALLGVSLEASRNVAVFAIAVPLVAAYLLSRRRSRRSSLAWLGVAACVLGAGVGGLFVVRLERGSGQGQAYLDRELDRQPAALRPFLPVYVNGALPLEAARRLNETVDLDTYDLGANTLASLPAAAFPEGKPPYGLRVGALMRTGNREQITWTVAGYQGRLLADLGWRGVVLGSALLGLAFGSLYRWARVRNGFLPIAVIAYVSYYSAYMLYENQLSFTIIAVFDLSVIALLAAYCTGLTDRIEAFLRSLWAATARERTPGSGA